MSERIDHWRRALPPALVAAVLLLVFAPVWLSPGGIVHSPRSDLLAFVHPYHAVQREALRDVGRPTLFDPTAFAGRPLTGDPQAALFYPTSWLVWLWPAGEGEGAYGLAILLHALIGAGGVLVWTRRSGLSIPARVAAALVFALGAKWLQHVLGQGHVVFLPAMWLPWQLAIVDRVRERPGVRPVAGLAMVTALVVLGCHTQLAFYAQCVVAAYALVACVTPPAAGRARVAIALAAAFVWSAALSAVALLPLAADLDRYTRAGGLAYEAAAARALSPAQLVAALRALEPAAVAEPPPFFGVVLLPLALLGALAAWRRARTRFALGLVVVAVLYALGEAGGLHRLLHAVVPGFDLFRIPSRALLVAGPGLAWLVACGVDALAPRAPAAAGRWVRAGAVGLALVGALLAILSRDASGLVLGVAWALPALGLLVPWPARVRAAMPSVVALLVVVDLVRVASPLVETRPLDEVLPRNPVVEAVAAPLGEGRVLAQTARSRGDLSVLPGTYASRAGIEGVRGFSPLVPRALSTYLQEGVGQVAPEERSRVTIPTVPVASRVHLDLLNVRFVASGTPLAVDGLALAQSFGPIEVSHYQVPDALTTLPATWLYENARRMPRAMLVREARHVDGPAAALAAIGAFDPRRLVLVEDPALPGRFPGEPVAAPVAHRMDRIAIDVDAGAGGFLVLAELYHPGWRARVDGQVAPVHRANGLFMVVALGPGRHAVTLRFRPRAFVAGAVLSGLAWAGAIGAGVAGRGPREGAEGRQSDSRGPRVER